MMQCGSGGWNGSTGLGHILSEVVAFTGHLASQVLVVITSGPALGFLSALVLILAAIALLKNIRGNRAKPVRGGVSREVET